jgi:hypothetical protein
MALLGQVLERATRGGGAGAAAQQEQLHVPGVHAPNVLVRAALCKKPWAP